MEIAFNPESRELTSSIADQHRAQGYQGPHKPSAEQKHQIMQAVHAKADELSKPGLLGELQYEEGAAYLTKEQDFELAEFIQAGKAVREQLIEDPFNLELRAIVTKADAARAALFEAHMPFALWCARESVGITHKSSFEKNSKNREGRLWGAATGTYRPLHSNKSPYADLEHREQSALFGLWAATDFYAPAGVHNARFITYAMYHVQKAIERDIQHEEHSGIRFPSGVHQDMATYFRNNPSNDPDDIDPKMKQLLELSRVPMEIDAYSDKLTHDYLEEPTEDDRPDSLSDYYGESLHQHFTNDVELNMLSEDLDLVMGTLSERQQDVMGDRYGLDDDVTRTYDQIAASSKVTRERIRQIEKAAILKLRERTMTSGELDEYRRLEEPFHSATPQQDGRAADFFRDPRGVFAQEDYSAEDHLRARYEKTMTIEEYYANEDQKAWQAFKGDAWGAPVRHILPDKARPKESITPDQREAMHDVIQRSSSYLFSAIVGKRAETALPASIVQRFVEISEGSQLLEQDIDELYWAFISEKLPFVAKDLGDTLSVARVRNLFDLLYEMNVSTEADEAAGYEPLETKRTLDELLEKHGA